MRRFLFVCCLALVTVGVAAALPAAEAPPVASAAAPAQAGADVVAHSRAALSSASEVAAPVGDPSHLAVDTVDAHPASAPVPAPIVTTSTTQPAAAAPAPQATTPPVVAPPATTAPSTVAFTATQAYGSCSEPVPYDVFSGTASPGVTVTVSSPYGSGSAVADSSGHWEQTVEFPGAPRGETFAVHVAAPDGSTTLSFMATGDAGSHA